MAKKSLKHPSGHFNKDTLQLNFCKWEFLRRNKKYQRDYDKIVKQYGDNFPDKIINVFQARWGIFSPYDYRETLPIRHILNLSNPNQFAYATIPNFMSASNKKYPTPLVKCLTQEVLFPKKPILGGGRIIPIPEEKLAKITEIDVRINLLAHKGKLSEEIAKIIKRWQDRRNKYYKLSPIRLNDYQLYWKIYDIKKQQPNITFKRLAQKVCKGLKVGDIQRSHEDQISKAYKTCCKLIDGGYQKIVL